MKYIYPPIELDESSEIVNVGPPQGVTEDDCMTVPMVKTEIKGGIFDGIIQYSGFIEVQPDMLPKEDEKLVVEVQFYGHVVMHQLVGWKLEKKDWEKE